MGTYSRRQPKLRWATLVVLFSVAGGQAATLRYWIEPCREKKDGCRRGDPELARWAMEAWQTAAQGGLHLQPAAGPERAHIRVHWATGAEGSFGETRPIDVNGERGAEVFVMPAVVPPGEPDGLLRDAIVYLTCVHEIGHALGLAHTADFADIMYSFQYGGDIAAYFARYRRLLSGRTDIRRHSGLSSADIQRLREIYR